MKPAPPKITTVSVVAMLVLCAARSDRLLAVLDHRGARVRPFLGRMARGARGVEGREAAPKRVPAAVRPESGLDRVVVPYPADGLRKVPAGVGDRALRVG